LSGADLWKEDKKIPMKKKTKKTKYTNEPMKLGKRVKDFLPPPSQLVAK